MHPALWKLYRLRVRGSLRAIVRRFKSRRGAALGVFTLLFLGMIIGPNLILACTVGFAGVMGRGADGFREAAPAAMLLMVIVSIITALGGRALYFPPAEVDFLFPAPFSRRQILVYKILGSVTGAVYVGLLFPLLMPLYIHSWPAAAVGFFLTSLIIGSLTMCVQLIAQSVTERAFTRARKLFLGGVIAAAAVALGQAASQGLNGNWQGTLLAARHSLPAEIVLAPFTVFARIITAERFVPDALGWAALGATMVVAAYALVIRLDANYLETAARVSRQIDQRRHRAAGGALFASRSGRVRSSPLPQPPWLGGVGPLVWRQAIQALRGSRGAIMLTAIAVLAMGVPLVFSARGGQHGVSAVLPHLVIGLAAYATFLISAWAPLGFQGDYERMDLLKSLPVRPLVMACGQMLVITAALTLLEWSIFTVTAVCVPAAAAELLAAGLFAVPYTWLLFGMENFLFLLSPSPRVATGSEGFLKMGRVMLFMLAKFFVLGLCGCLAAVPAVVVYLLCQSLPAACLAGWVTLLLPAVGILLLIAWAFQRYDVSAGAAE